jgi:hypothetical protein
LNTEEKEDLKKDEEKGEYEE